MSSNRFNPEKLLMSKWTATRPIERQKHFLITELIRDADERVEAVVIQAVLTRREQQIRWQELKDASVWRQGWK